MPDFINPGSAAVSAISKYVLDREVRQRQAHQDALHEEQVHAEMKMRQSEFDRKQLEDDRNDTYKQLNEMLPGDVPDADLVKKAQRLGIGHLMSTAGATIPAGQTNVQMPGQTVSPLTGTPYTDESGKSVNEPVSMFGAQPAQTISTGVRFIGSPAQRQADIKKKEVDDFIAGLPDQLAGMSEDDPRRTALLLKYEQMTGRPVSSELFKQPKAATEGTEDVLRASSNRRGIEKYNPTTQTWEPVTAAPKKGAHWLQEPTPSQAGTGQADARHDRAYNTAITELSKRAVPVEALVNSVNDLGARLNEKTPTTDALIAPIVLKATVSGAGSGFRMTQAEINQVLGSGSHWDRLQVALAQWDPDHSQALKLTDEQRDDLRKMAKAIRTKASKQMNKVMDTRHALDDAPDVDTIHRHMTKLQGDLAEVEDPDKPATSTSTSTLKVLKIEKQPSVK